jgi:hypothetical protein
MTRQKLAMGLGGFIVAFVSVGVLRENGYQNAPVIVLGAGLLAGGVVAIIVAIGR